MGCKESNQTNKNKLPMFFQLQGKGEQEDIDKRINQIKDDIELSSSEYEKEKLNERLAKLSNGIAVVKVNISKMIEVCFS